MQGRGRKQPLGVTPLPEGLTERLIRLETAFSERPKLSTLNELISLYSVCATQTAIEHYEAMQNPIHLQYQERLRMMLKQRDVGALLNYSAPNSPMSSPRGGTFGEVVSLRPRDRPRRLAPGVSSLTFRDAREIDTLLQSSQSESTITVKKIQNDLHAQISGASNRLHLRKQRSPKAGDAQSPTSPKHFQFPPTEPVPNPTYEKELERILEKHIRMKVERQNKLLEQYESQIKELETGPKSAIVGRVISEMQRAYERDIATLDEEIEASKRQEISALQSRLRPFSPH